MASFEAKIGWKGMRTRENNNYRSVPFQSHPQYKIKKKKTKNFKKLKNTIMTSFEDRIGWKR